MFIRLLLIWHALGTALQVIASRWRRGPLHAGWGFLEELVATGMKRHFARLALLPWPEQRRTWAAVALPPLAHLTALRFERVTWAGMPALRIRARSGADAPTLFYLHGGGYLFGSTDEYRDHLGRLARAAGVQVLAIDYRLAPEHPFPAALEDAVAAYRALLDSGVPVDRIVLAGDSAGGGLAVALLVAARDLGLPLPPRAALLCPWVDLAAQGGTMESNSPSDVFTPPLVAGWARVVLAGADPTDPRISVVRADLRGLPPLLLQVGGAEMLRDQDLAFAERAQAAGVNVTLRVWENCIHDWPMYAALLASGRRAIDELAAFIRGG